MQAGRRYSIFQSLRWTYKSAIVFILYASIATVLFEVAGLKWLTIPWQPISLIGIAVAFYLGFKNNSSYDRLWEARKIWGGIVNASRSYTVMFRDFVTHQFAIEKKSEEHLRTIHKTVVHRHIAWLYALTYQLRKLQPWEHVSARDKHFREVVQTTYSDNQFEKLQQYLSAQDYAYIMQKGNRASHLLSLQSKTLKELRSQGLIDDFRHMELQNLITEFYTLQGKSERIKNFPFPRQYASANFYFIIVFLVLLPFGMLDIFSALTPTWKIWLSIPFSALASWVFWFMEAIGEYSENPFEGLYNDVPITQMANGIEKDIRQMLDEENIPDPVSAKTDMEILT